MAGQPAAVSASAARRILLRKWSPTCTCASTIATPPSNTFESIRREAWEVAYRHIYSQDEIDRYFDGKSQEGRTWPSMPCQHEETLICEVQQPTTATRGTCAGTCTANAASPQQSSTRVCAYAKWGWTRNAQAELHSLYVSPQYWNQGCGSMLWEAIMKTCGSEQITSMDIWVLKAARSGEFYAARGCKCVDEGDYFIGDKRETAQNYRWTPKI